MNEVNNQVTVEKVKKGVSPGIVFLLVIIFSAIFGVGGWFLGTKLANQEDKKTNDTKVEENKETNENNEVLPNKNTSYTFVKEETKTLKFNTESVNLYSYYYVDKESVKDSDEKTVETYILRREVYLNNKLIGGIRMLDHYNTQDEAVNAISKFPLKDYVSLKDTTNGNYYNIIDLDVIESVIDGYLNMSDSDYKKAYLVDKEGNVLKEFDSAFWGTDVIGVFADATMIKGKFSTPINKEPDMDYPEGKDYYLYPDNRLIDAYESHIYYFTNSSDACAYEEKKLTVENGKVVEVLLNTYSDYDDLNLAGQTC